MLLDIDTGGGEFLLSLNHPYTNTAATENYPPNVKLCEETLIPLGINFKRADVKNKLPFRDNSFDIVINRHGNLSPSEFYRVLKNGGIFISQQVGAENDRELVELLCGKLHLPFPNQYASIIADEFKNAGFKILQKKECFRPIRFFDLGALTWFARVLPWEFQNFSVDNNIENLIKAQEILNSVGYIEGKTHRFLIAAQK
jgi:SAM-dependent methyltransferase